MRGVLAERAALVQSSCLSGYNFHIVQGLGCHVLTQLRPCRYSRHPAYLLEVWAVPAATKPPHSSAAWSIALRCMMPSTCPP